MSSVCMITKSDSKEVAKVVKVHLQKYISLLLLFNSHISKTSPSKVTNPCETNITSKE